MEAIIFCGIQATGKSTFFKNHFFKTHVHISLDLLKTRHRETLFLEVCLKTQQSFVVDNTNPTQLERSKYIDLAKKHHFKVVGYYFQSKVKAALERNRLRTGKEFVPEVGIKGTAARLEFPRLEDGYDELYYVEIVDNQFLIQKWSDEI
jgi:predicted kinase